MTQEIGSNREQFSALLGAAQQDGIALARGQGAYMAYFTASDHQVGASESSRLAAIGGYEDQPSDFKVHLNPEDDQLIPAFTAAVRRARGHSLFRESLHEAKVWFGGTDEQYDNLPRIVLYPRNGSELNTLTVVRHALAWLGDMGIRGSGRTPRFNYPVVEGLCYVAQGSSSDKQEDPTYREQFDPHFNYAFIRDTSLEMRVLLDDVANLPWKI
ncbi:MAG TPA: hypothetical protein VHB72_04865 [Candidatus Saccharimonadales bacterium]|nr:hypothetical protein [Candidatus Saccharimonadales bacterium]